MNSRSYWLQRQQNCMAERNRYIECVVKLLVFDVIWIQWNLLFHYACIFIVYSPSFVPKKTTTNFDTMLTAAWICYLKAKSGTESEVEGKENNRNLIFDIVEWKRKWEKENKNNNHQHYYQTYRQIKRMEKKNTQRSDQIEKRERNGMLEAENLVHWILKLWVALAFLSLLSPRSIHIEQTTNMIWILYEA